MNNFTTQPLTKNVSDWDIDCDVEPSKAEFIAQVTKTLKNCKNWYGASHDLIEKSLFMITNLRSERSHKLLCRTFHIIRLEFSRINANYSRSGNKFTIGLDDIRAKALSHTMCRAQPAAKLLFLCLFIVEPAPLKPAK